jgi:hypothetical protein
MCDRKRRVCKNIKLDVSDKCAYSNSSCAEGYQLRLRPLLLTCAQIAAASLAVPARGMLFDMACHTLQAAVDTSL